MSALTCGSIHSGSTASPIEGGSLLYHTHRGFRMARRSALPPKPKSPILTVGQKRRRIERLQKCVTSLEAFDPQKARKRAPMVLALEAAIWVLSVRQQHSRPLHPARRFRARAGNRAQLRQILFANCQFDLLPPRRHELNPLCESKQKA